MAIIFIDGFDTYNGTGTTTGVQIKYAVSGTTTLQTGRFGGQCIQANGAVSFSSWFRRTLPATYTTLGAGFSMRFQTYPSDSATGAHVALLLNTAYNLGFRVTVAGAIEVYRLTGGGSGTSLGKTADGLILPNTWHSVEFGTTINTTTGSFVLIVDGATVLTLNNVNTATTAGINQIQFGASNANQSLGNVQFDDLYVTDTVATLGPRRIETIYPSSDVVAQFTRLSGTTNFSNVNEALMNGDTSYVQATNVGEADLYGLGDLASNPAAIDCVQISNYALKTDVATRTLALQVKSGASTTDGPAFTLASGYSKFERVLEKNPDGNVNWNVTSVNALQTGPKVAG